MTTPSDFGFDVLDALQCARCGGALSRSADALACGACGEHIPIADDIIDFVKDSARTTLDDLDYDQFYRITDQRARALIESIKAYAGGRWPQSLGRVIEIGAGTGGSTMGLAAVTDFRHIVVTDLSFKMLHLCRRNLDAAGLLQPSKMTFVTYGATQNCFRPASFDTAFGSSVLHHITDVASFLGDLSRLLVPGGGAFFIEPCMPFHRALTATLADIVAALLREGFSVEDIRIARMCNWIAEVRCNLLRQGDLEFLATREDKHMFSRETMEALAHPAGLEVAPVAFGPDPSGWSALAVYLTQCEVGAELLERVRAVLPRYALKHMAALQPEDLAPSYLLCLTKMPETGEAAHGPALSSPSIAAGSSVPIRFDLSVETIHEGGTLAVDGWCYASTDLAWLILRIDHEEHRIPIWLPNSSLLIADSPADIPLVNVLCSGVFARIPLGNRTWPLEIDIEAATATGSASTLSRITLGSGEVKVLRSPA